MKRFGITIGDPCGIGPEITLKALHASSQYQQHALLFGSRSILDYYNKASDTDLPSMP
jgi:4-hydroxythreonine-4-phosphate dehydrogenase